MEWSMLVPFGAYLLILLVVGGFAARQTRDLPDYILGGRRMGTTVTALSAGASDMSGWLLLGLPGAVYASGMSQAWIAVGLALGAYLNWLWVAPRLRVQTEQLGNALTLPEFLGNRYPEQAKLLRLVSASVILLFFTFYTSAGLVSGALLFEQSFGLEYQTALLIGTAVIVTYTFIGGFIAVSWTDLLQGLLMLLALLVVPIAGFYSAADTSVCRVAPYHLDWFHGLTVLGWISLMAWGLGYFGQPHILARFMAIRSAEDIPKAREMGMDWMMLSLGGAIFTGLAGVVYFNGPLNDPETVFPTLVKMLFNPWVAGILLAAILSAIMSTIDSQLLVASSVITEDFYRKIFHPQAKQSELLWVGRVSVVLIAIIALFLAQDRDSKILDLVGYAWAGFGGAFGPVILFTLFWPRTTGLAVLAGMITGAVTVVAWKSLTTSGVMPFTLYEIVPAFVLASGMIALVGGLQSRSR